MNDSNLGRYTHLLNSALTSKMAGCHEPWRPSAFHVRPQPSTLKKASMTYAAAASARLASAFFSHMYVFTAVYYTPPRMKVDCWIKWTPFNLFHPVSCPKSLHWYRRHVFSKIQWDSSCHGFLCARAHGRSPRRAGSDCRAAEGIEGNGREWSVLALQPGNGQPAQCTGQSAKRGKSSWHEPWVGRICDGISSRRRRAVGAKGTCGRVGPWVGSAGLCHRGVARKAKASVRGLGESGISFRAFLMFYDILTKFYITFFPPSQPAACLILRDPSGSLSLRSS